MRSRRFSLFLLVPVVLLGLAIAAGAAGAQMKSSTHRAAAAGGGPIAAPLGHTLAIARKIARGPDDDIPGVAIPASPFTGTLNHASDSDDVFRVHLDAGQTLHASITGAAGTNFDLYFYPPGTSTVNGTDAVAGATSNAYPDHFVYTATQSGTFYLDAWAHSGSGAYTITYTIKIADADDDVPGVALPASPFSDSLATAADDDDVFSFHLDAGQTLHASMTGAAGTDFDLYLYPPGQASVNDPGEVAGADLSSYPDTFVYTATQSGTFYLDAWAHSGSGAYTITYTIKIAEADDDVPGVALPASPVSDSLATASDDDDVYALSLSAGQAFDASLTGALGTNFDLYLYPPGTATVNSSGFVASAHSATYPDYLAYTATQSGTFYLDAYGYNGTGAYTIIHSIVAAPTTAALAKVTVKKGKAATFRFKVTAATPTAKVTIKIYKGAALKKTLTVGLKPTGSNQSYKCTCTLAKATYTWKVYAIDLLGNSQWKVGSQKLVVN